MRPSAPRRLLPVTLLAIVGLAVSPAVAQRGSRTTPPRGAERIEAAQMRDYLTFLASDELEGRDTPSRGLDVAARFLATQLARWGLKAAGDEGGYFQTIAMTRRVVDPATTTLTLGERSFTYGEDFVATVPGKAEGGLVYVGHGHVVKKKGLDAYTGIDVKGRIVIAHAGLPEGVSRFDLRGESGEAWETPATYAARHGALGVVLVPDFQSLSAWRTTREGGGRGGAAVTVDLFTADRPAPVPVITASAALVAALFEGEKVGGAEIFRRVQERKEGEGFALADGKRLAMHVGAHVDSLRAQNVVAIHEGSDPALKGEYVAVGAHYDHVGVARTGSDRVFNGADDDGSGTTALLAMAEALSRGTVKTKRSVLFVWHAGEERGLLGSRYFVTRPTVPLERIVAMLNVDMIGRSRAADDGSAANATLTGPEEIYVIGSKMMSSALGELSERVNRSYLDLSFNYKYDDPDDSSRFFFRSDHYNYAKQGIPIVFYFSGVHADYHRVSDEVAKIDFAKMEKVTRTIYATALALADAPSRPAVDRKLPAQLTEP
jgi:hypothetical protein